MGIMSGGDAWDVEVGTGRATLSLSRRGKKRVLRNLK